MASHPSQQDPLVLLVFPQSDLEHEAHCTPHPSDDNGLQHHRTLRLRTTQAYNTYKGIYTFVKIKISYYSTLQLWIYATLGVHVPYKIPYNIYSIHGKWKQQADHYRTCEKHMLI